MNRRQKRAATRARGPDVSRVVGSGSTERRLGEAVSCHQAGRLTEAKRLYGEVLSREPNNVVALHLLGVIECQEGDAARAVELIGQAIALRPDYTEAHNNLGNVLRDMGRPEEASAAYRKALELDPNDAEALYNLGNALRSQDKLEEAVASYRRALASKPDFAEAHNNLGNALRDLDRLEEAVAAYHKALALKPDHANTHNNLGNALRDLGRPEEAAAAYHRALASKPDFAEAHNNLGNALRDLGRPEEAEASYRRALASNPGYAEAHNNLGATLRDQGKLEEAVAAYRRAVALKPGYAEAHNNLGSALRDQGELEAAVAAYNKALESNPDYQRAEWGARLTLPVLYETEDEIESHRERWERGIKTLLDNLDLGTEGKVKQAEGAVISQTNFYLHYQGRNDRRLQKLYGSLVHRIAAAAYPEFSQPLSRRDIVGGRRIRVGFVSSHLRNHSVYKTHGRWITKLDRDRFEVHAFHTGTGFDQATEEIKRHSAVFHSGIHANRDLIATVRSSELDVLVYLDIGMEPKTQLHAALRLAPVQCTTWGHPVTSGLPTIDYYLSSDLMEPDEAQAHYSERLVKLPNLSVSYALPELPDALGPNTRRAKFGGPVVYLCSQSLYKLLPQYDALYARIAALVPNSRFWFIANPSKAVTGRFQARLARAFDRHGLSAKQHCVIKPRMNYTDFLALNRSADIALDSLLWSGCNSTFDAIACGLPVVTLPGPMMRGRHSYAILKMMGIEETIARDEDHYVELAVRLGKDGAWRGHIAEKVEAARSRVFNDETPIRALEDFFERVCGPTG